jgi:hypothetical protein
VGAAHVCAGLFVHYSEFTIGCVCVCGALFPCPRTLASPCVAAARELESAVNFFLGSGPPTTPMAAGDSTAGPPAAGAASASAGSSAHHSIGCAVFNAPLAVPLPLQAKRLDVGGVAVTRFVVQTMTQLVRRGVKILFAEAITAMHDTKWVRLPSSFNFIRKLHGAFASQLPLRHDVEQRLQATGGDVASGLAVCALAGWPARPPVLPPASATYVVCPGCFCRLLQPQFGKHAGVCKLPCPRPGGDPPALGPSSAPDLPPAATALLYPLLRSATATFLRSALPSVRGKAMLSEVTAFLGRVFLLTPASVEALLLCNDDFTSVCPTLRALLPSLDPDGWSLQDVVMRARAAAKPRVKNGRATPSSLAGVEDSILLNCVTAGIELQVHMARVKVILTARRAGRDDPVSIPLTMLPEHGWTDQFVHVSRAAAPALRTLTEAFSLWTSARQDSGRAADRDPDELWRGCVTAVRHRRRCKSSGARPAGAGVHGGLPGGGDNEEEEEEDEEGGAGYLDEWQAMGEDDGSSAPGPDHGAAGRVDALLQCLNVEDVHVKRLLRLNGRPFAFRMSLTVIQLLFPRPRVSLSTHTCGRGCIGPDGIPACHAEEVEMEEEEEEEEEGGEEDEWAPLLSSMNLQRRTVEVCPQPPSIKHFNSALLSRCRPSFAAGVSGLYHGEAAVGHVGRVAGFDPGRHIILSGEHLQLTTKVFYCGVCVGWGVGWWGGGGTCVCAGERKGQGEHAQVCVCACPVCV